MKAVFIDRDGTMGGSYNVEFPQDYYAYEGTAEAFELLNRNGFSPMIFTNQSCIARGKDNGYDFACEFKNIGAADWFICPHDTADNCNCRKPKTGLLEQAKQKYKLNMNECFVIGDRWSDMLAGGKMGCKLILVKTGRGGEALGCDREKWAEYEPVLVADTLYEAAKWLCGEVKP
ncbi:MAG: HAD-IIIA family hydrolase [Clostridia bacterium]|nr:HAD-IIIA family hydrolase [Clostridia bacterium]